MKKKPEKLRAQMRMRARKIALLSVAALAHEHGTQCEDTWISPLYGELATEVRGQLVAIAMQLENEAGKLRVTL